MRIMKELIDSKVRREREGITKEAVLKIVKDVSTDRGALYRDIHAKVLERGWDKTSLEECILELLEDGLIYEPLIGIIKVV
jgi:hypothetical protein